MLRGDLALTPLDEVLRLLADDQLTGRLALNDGGKGAQARSAEVYVATGEIYAAWLAEADADPVLAADERLRVRLLAEGVLPPDAWDDALAAQEELYDWSIGELLVELGHLERDVLEQVARQELLDAVAQASAWTLGTYRFRRRERTRNRAGRTYTVSDFLEAVSRTSRRACTARDLPRLRCPRWATAPRRPSDSRRPCSVSWTASAPWRTSKWDVAAPASRSRGSFVPSPTTDTSRCPRRPSNWWPRTRSRPPLTRSTR